VHGRPDPVRSPPPVASLLAATVSGRTHHPALAFAETTLSYQELSAAADRLAVAMAVAPGERVAVVAPNVPALVTGLFATWRAGGVAVPLSARLRRFELERAFGDASPVAAVCVAEHAGFALAAEIGELAKRTPSLRACVVVDQLGEIVDATGWEPHEWPSRSPPELAAIMYTSGTTGEPKGVLVSHALAGAMARNLADVLGEDAAAPYGLVVPASHAFGLGCLLCGIVAGATSVMVDATTSLDPLVRALRRHHARLLHGSPALFGRLLRSGADLSVHGGFVAGSWCPPEVLRALEERGIRVLNLYGMTELGAVSSCRADDPPRIRYRTVGRPLPGYELRVEDGEIQVRSQFLHAGYHRRAWSSEELTSDGWLRTGDLGQLDAAGNLVIAGRAKEVVQVGGFNVFPAEVESFLLTHPAIEHAAVIGVSHPVLGEALEAFVMPTGDAKLEPVEVVRFARAGIAGYKVPYAVHVIDELPLLASGKPDRRELARLAELKDVAH
jgi:long-chain acyl-CoA synthetase